MKWIISLLLTLVLSTNVFAQSIFGNGGGDDAGNGGFAYKQSMKILKLAADGLEGKIKQVDMQEFKDHPEWRTILSKVLKHDNLEKTWWKSKTRNGQPLSMDYNIKTPKVIILKAYYQAFMGKTDNEIEESVEETQKRLVHEASHIWGYNEEASDEFAERFLISANNLATRSNHDIQFNSKICACLNGKADSAGDCDSFCAKVPVTSSSTLYLEAVLGQETLKNPRTQNVYQWCNNQLESDVGAPGCTISAWDGTNKIELPIRSMNVDSNKFVVDSSQLYYNQDYVLKLIESRSSKATSNEFQFKKIKYKDPNNNLNMIKLDSVNQFTCLTYFGSIASDGSVSKTNYKRDYFFYPGHEAVDPIPSSNSFQSFVCHDEVQYGPVDSALYPRLETIPNKISLLNKIDPAFIQENNTMKINFVLKNRLFDEFGISTEVNIINSLSFVKAAENNRTNYLGGYFVVPFINTSNNQAYCPTAQEYNGGAPLLKLMHDYFPELEGLYIAESEPTTIENNGNSKTYYSNQFIRESDVLNYGFIVSDGQKIRVNSNTIHNNAVYFYYPFNEYVNPTEKGTRILFKIKSADELNGIRFNLNLNYSTSDKRVGCIPKSQTQKDEHTSKQIGESCGSDYQCGSLCCDTGIGACQAHDPLKGIFCTKAAGQFCITSAFCEKKFVPVCNLYKNGTNMDGTPKCVIRCPNVVKSGDCVNNACVEPYGDTDTSKFDLQTCKGAIDP